MSDHSVVVVLYGLCAAAVVYAYLVYPIVIWMLSRFFGRPRHAATIETIDLPSVSVLIAAHNEEDVIAERLRNALALEYPKDRFEVVVASDHSTDRTAAIVSEFVDDRLRLFDYHVRRGKAAVLNDAVASLRGDIVVFSDANAFMKPDVLRRLAAWFQDPRVGVACGRLVLTDSVRGNNVDSIYWKYENFLKTCEARLDALLGANGAIYAIRRRLFAPLSPGTLIDDFVLPLTIKLQSGCQIIYDKDSVAFEETPLTIAAEFGRRSRIGAGGFQSLRILWRLLLPSKGWIALTFFSHKVLRWLCPFLLLAMLVTNLLLVDEPGWTVALALQGVVYLSAIAGLLVPGSGAPSRVLRLVGLFISMNLALLIGFGQWAIRVPRGSWQRTPRSPRATVGE